MIYPIHIIGSPVLRKTAKNIDKDYLNLETVIENMKETMYSSDGIGLAAPQIGKAIRLFLLDASALADENPEFKDFKRTFINAKIIEHSNDTVKSNEGCLSIPGVNEDVDRFSKIKIEYDDENFEHKIEEFEGMIAIIIQHEYDHLDGILFTDKITPIRKRLIKKKLQNISKGKFDARYNFRLK